MTEKLETPVIIVGAGPAGAATSIFLSKAKIPHIIIDKAVFPRDKVCGDALSGKTLFVMRKANPDWAKEIFNEPGKYTASHGIMFVAPNGKSIDIPFKGRQHINEPTAGFTSPRLTFDHFLFKKIDPSFATVFEDATLQKIKVEDPGVTVLFNRHGKNYEVHAKIIVGADGDKSQVQKSLSAIKASPKTHSVGLRAYYEGVTGMRENNFIELHFLPEMLPGYFWIFPLPNGQANVGVGIPSERVRTKKINLRELMLKTIEENVTISQRFKNAKLTGKIQGWGLPLAAEPKPISGNHFILTGDAACLIDPFSGEGIGNALYSGMLAAGAITKAIDIKRFDEAFLKQAYDDILYGKLGSELKLSGRLQTLCKLPWLFNFLVNKARKSPALSQTMSSMFADVDLRQKLKSPSFYVKIIFNR